MSVPQTGAVVNHHPPSIAADLKPRGLPQSQRDRILEDLVLDAVQGKPRGIGTKKIGTKNISSKPTITKNGRPRGVGHSRRTTLAEAQRVGAFQIKQVFDDGDAIYTYCKLGEAAHDVRVRGGAVVWCGCEDARFRPRPEGCKHVRLYRQQQEGPGLIDAAAKAAAEFESAWGYHQMGVGSDEECVAAFERLTAARDAMRKVVCS